MCHLLLHRRELEGGLPVADYPEEYRNLNYQQKRSLILEIALHMVRNEVSAAAEDDLQAIVAKTLETFPNVAAANSRSVLRSLVERSGVLREHSAGVIDFVHNTIKEFLAAEGLMRSRDIPMLARHATDDSWRQVIMFAVAAADLEFATRLVSEMLELANQAADARIRHQLELAAVCCRSSATRLQPQLISRLAQVERSLIPPANFGDAEALASGGDQVVPLLRYRKMKARQAASSVRTLRLVGTRLARRQLEGYLHDTRQIVVSELCQAVNPLLLRAIQGEVKAGRPLARFVAAQITDLEPLRHLADMQKLVLDGIGAVDLSPLSELQQLRSILRWSQKIGQVLKLGSPWLKDEPDDGQAEEVFGGFQGEGRS